MDALATIVGVGVFSALIFFFSFQIEQDKHFILRMFLIFVGFTLLILIPKVLMDEQTVCAPIVANTTVTGNFTSYEYTDHCYTYTNSTPSTFYEITLWFYRIFIAYIIVYLFVIAIKAMMDSHKKGRI